MNNTVIQTNQMLQWVMGGFCFCFFPNREREEFDLMIEQQMKPLQKVPV